MARTGRRTSPSTAGRPRVGKRRIPAGAGREGHGRVQLRWDGCIDISGDHVTIKYVHVAYMPSVGGYQWQGTVDTERGLRPRHADRDRRGLAQRGGLEHDRARRRLGPLDRPAQHADRQGMRELLLHRPEDPRLRDRPGRPHGVPHVRGRHQRHDPELGVPLVLDLRDLREAGRPDPRRRDPEQRLLESSALPAGQRHQVLGGLRRDLLRHRDPVQRHLGRRLRLVRRADHGRREHPAQQPAQLRACVGLQRLRQLLGVRRARGPVSSARFVDAANGNFRLRRGSPAIGHGSPLNFPRFDKLGKRRPWGKRADAGAFEARYR